MLKVNPNFKGSKYEGLIIFSILAILIAWGAVYIMNSSIEQIYRNNENILEIISFHNDKIVLFEEYNDENEKILKANFVKKTPIGWRKFSYSEFLRPYNKTETDYYPKFSVMSDITEKGSFVLPYGYVDTNVDKVVWILDNLELSFKVDKIKRYWYFLIPKDFTNYKVQEFYFILKDGSKYDPYRN